MAQIKIIIRSIGLGMASLGAGWDWSSAPSTPIESGLARHFENVGASLSRAAARFQQQHPEVVHA